MRLTPETPLSPSVNGARIVGATPGARVLFQVPVSGERPMKIQAAGLPSGLRMDSRGLVTGTAPAKKGEYKVKIQASNRHGKDAKEWILKVGDELCLTPPMGWSSWYSYSEAVGQENVLTARLFVEQGGGLSTMAGPISILTIAGRASEADGISPSSPTSAFRT